MHARDECHGGAGCARPKLKEIHYIFVTWTAITFAFCVPAKPLRIIYLFVCIVCFFFGQLYSLSKACRFFFFRSCVRCAHAFKYTEWTRIQTEMKSYEIQVKFVWCCVADEFYFFRYFRMAASTKKKKIKKEPHTKWSQRKLRPTKYWEREREREKERRTKRGK